MESTTKIRLVLEVVADLGPVLTGEIISDLEGVFGVGNVKVTSALTLSDQHPQTQAAPLTLNKLREETREAKLARQREAKRVWRAANREKMTKSESGKLGAHARWAQRINGGHDLKPRPARKGKAKPVNGERMEDYTLKVMPAGEAVHIDTVAKLVYEAGYRGSRSKEALRGSLAPLMSDLKKRGLVNQTDRNIYTRTA